MTKTTKAIVDRLDEIIALLRAETRKERWIDVKTVAAIFSCTTAYARDRLALRPGFPQPLPGGRPRWMESEVQDWAIEYRRHYEGTDGRRKYRKPLKKKSQAILS